MSLPAVRGITAMQRHAAGRLFAQGYATRTGRISPYSTTTSTRSPSVVQFLSYDPRRRQEEQRQQQRQIQVYQRALFRDDIVATPGLVWPHPLRSFSSTTSASSSDDKSEKTVRQVVTDRAADLREKARDLRDKTKESYADLRENAKESYKEFREHPRESMREGAKSFSGMMRKYGPVFIGTYGVVYFTTLGSLFVAVQGGVLDPVYLFSLLGEQVVADDAGVVGTPNTVDLVVDWMKNHAFTEQYAPVIEERPYLANLAVAWIAVKFTEPFRAAVALSLTPRVARFFGFVEAKPPAAAASSQPTDDPKAAEGGASTTTAGSTTAAAGKNAGETSTPEPKM